MTRQISRQWIVRVCVGMIVLFSGWVLVRGQASVLTDGTLVTGELIAGTPIVYTFSGQAEDIVTLTLHGNVNFAATMTLTDSNNAEIATSTTDRLTASPYDARLTLSLPQTGVYILVLTGENDLAAPFALTFDVVMATEINELATGRLALTLPADSPSQYVRVQANPAIPQVISIQSLRPAGEFSALIYDVDGDIRATINGGLEGSTFVIPAQEGSYLIALGPVGDEDTELEIAILAGAVVDAEATQEPADTDTTDTTDNTDEDTCIITIGETPVNVRSGPGTVYEVVNGLGVDDEFIATGQNGAWYSGTLNGRAGWVAASVTTQNNLSVCSALPFVTAPPPPTATPTNTPTYTPLPTSTPTQMMATSTSTAPPTATTGPETTESP